MQPRRSSSLQKAPVSKISPARAAAYQVLFRVETRESYAAELLHSELLRDLSAVDRSLATEIVFGVLRWQSKLDTRIARVSGRPPAKLDPEVRIALRIAAYQILNLERIPARAAVNDSVELVKLARKRSAVPFANAVLRKLASASDGITDAPSAEDSAAARLAAQYAHPVWLVERWIRNFGPEKTDRICQFDQERPVTAIRISSMSAEDQLRAEGVTLEPGAIVASARRLRSGDITQTTPWRERKIFIQDEASQLVALLVGQGNKILDCCAAPGGKTSAIAARNPAALIAACELHTHRARKMRELIAGEKIHIIAADAQHLPFRILEGAVSQLETGGRLLYSTCSLEPEEGEAVVEAALRKHPGLRIVPMGNELTKLREAGDLIWAELDSLIAGAYLRTIPGIHPCDGFFVALIECVR